MKSPVHETMSKPSNPLGEGCLGPLPYTSIIHPWQDFLGTALAFDAVGLLSNPKFLGSNPSVHYHQQLDWFFVTCPHLKVLQTRVPALVDVSSKEKQDGKYWEGGCHLLHKAKESWEAAMAQNSKQVLVQNELLCCTTGWVIERNLLRVSHQTLHR
jgi:hypothetical protein